MSKLMKVGFACALMLHTYVSSLETNIATSPTNQNIEFQSKKLSDLIPGSIISVTFNTSATNVTDNCLVSSNENVATVSWNHQIVTNISYATGNFSITAVSMGYATITLKLTDLNDMVISEGKLSVSVTRDGVGLSKIFSTSLGIIVAIFYMIMGTTLDLTIIKGILKRPIGPVLGLFCQYIIMPLVGFGLSQVAFKDAPFKALGMFLAGTAPGGGQSNVWTHLLGGNLDLSCTMTFISTVTAFGAIPLWIIFLGPVIFRGTDFNIPYDQIALLVLAVVAPSIIGILIKRFTIKLSRILERLMTPYSVLLLLYIVTFGFYANRYVFTLIDAKVALLALCLPCIGYLLGLLLALLFRQPFPDCVAISIETGIQNSQLPLFILNYTIPPPGNFLSIIIPVCVGLLTPLPPMLVLVVKRLWLCWSERRTSQDQVMESAMNKSIEIGAVDVDLGIENPGLELNKENNIEEKR